MVEAWRLSILLSPMIKQYSQTIPNIVLPVSWLLAMAGLSDLMRDPDFVTEFYENVAHDFVMACQLALEIFVQYWHFSPQWQSIVPSTWKNYNEIFVYLFIFIAKISSKFWLLVIFCNVFNISSWKIYYEFFCNDQFYDQRHVSTNCYYQRTGISY